MSEANKAAAMRLFGMMNGADLSGAAEVVAPSFVDHEEVPGVDTGGVEGFKATVGFFRGAFPDLKFETPLLVAEGDMVAVHFHVTGTNRGEFMGMPATGKPVDLHGADLLRFENGKLVEHWGYMEQMKMMQQLGMMPS
jgi:predicted ester cyclase